MLAKGENFRNRIALTARTPQVQGQYRYKAGYEDAYLDWWGIACNYRVKAKSIMMPYLKKWLSVWICLKTTTKKNTYDRVPAK